MYVHSHYVTKDFIFNVAQSTSVIVFLMYEQHAYIAYIKKNVKFCTSFTQS